MKQQQIVQNVLTDVMSSTAFRSLLEQEIVLSADTLTEDVVVSAVNRILVSPLVVDKIYGSISSMSAEGGVQPASVEIVVDITTGILSRVVYDMLRAGSFDLNLVRATISDNIFLSTGAAFTAFMINLTKKNTDCTKLSTEKMW